MINSSQNSDYRKLKCEGLAFCFALLCFDMNSKIVGENPRTLNSQFNCEVDVLPNRNRKEF